MTAASTQATVATSSVPPATIDPTRLTPPRRRPHRIDRPASARPRCWRSWQWGILDRQDPAIRELLLGTAVLEELTPRLCRFVRDDPGAGALPRRVRATTLVVDAGAVYRYHAVLRTALIADAKRCDGGEVRGRLAWRNSAVRRRRQDPGALPVCRLGQPGWPGSLGRAVRLDDLPGGATRGCVTMDYETEEGTDAGAWRGSVHDGTVDGS